MSLGKEASVDVYIFMGVVRTVLETTMGSYQGDICGYMSGCACGYMLGCACGSSLQDRIPVGCGFQKQGLRASNPLPFLRDTVFDFRIDNQR